MSFVIAVPELVQDGAQDLAGIGSSLADAAAAASGPTVGIVAAAQDEVSTAIASLFGQFGQEFHALGAQAAAFHAQFVESVNAGAGAYAGGEAANAERLLAGAAPSVGVPTQWQQIFETTSGNAQTVFGASRQALGTLSGGICTEVGLLATNPAVAFTNLKTAWQSVTLIGAPGNVASAVVNHTLGGITTAFDGDGVPTPVPDAHIEIYAGLVGQGDFNPGEGLEAALVGSLTNFASSPLSGVLIGFAGPVVSPAVALFNSTHAILSDLTGGNPTAALSELVHMPGDVVNAFFNGATLDLDPLAPVFSPFVAAGDNGGEQLTGMSLAFGGLFSPGQVVDGPGGPMYFGTGGSALNALGLDISFVPPDDYAGGYVDIPAVPVGPIGATAGLIDIIGHALHGSLIG